MFDRITSLLKDFLFLSFFISERERFISNLCFSPLNLNKSLAFNVFDILIFFLVWKLKVPYLEESENFKNWLMPSYIPKNKTKLPPAVHF